MAQKLKIDILYKKTFANIPKNFVKQIIMACVKFLENEIPDFINEISLVFVSDKEIHLLNKEYRKKNKPTDVLSFPQFSKKELYSNKQLAGSSLGDIVISVDTTKKQAKEFEVSEKEELTRLLVHGFLHLLGYDHEKVSKNEAEKMRRKERKIRTFLMNNDS